MDRSSLSTHIRCKPTAYDRYAARQLHNLAWVRPEQCPYLGKVEMITTPKVVSRSAYGTEHDVQHYGDPGSLSNYRAGDKKILSRIAIIQSHQTTFMECE